MADSTTNEDPLATADYQVFTTDDSSIPTTHTLQVNRAYSGAQTSEAAILPGSYNETDARLFGMAQWLVDNGYAVWTS